MLTTFLAVCIVSMFSRWVWDLKHDLSKLKHQGDVRHIAAEPGTEREPLEFAVPPHPVASQRAALNPPLWSGHRDRQGVKTFVLGA